MPTQIAIFGCSEPNDAEVSAAEAVGEALAAAGAAALALRLAGAGQP